MKVWLAISAALIAALWAHGPIAQDQAYHAMADRRTIFGVPNGLDTLSNLGFAIAGAIGLTAVAGARGLRALPERAARRAYRTFFTGAVLTAIGSSWYHLAPDDARLVWDRIPMTIAFMALVSAVIAERVSPRTASRALVPLVVLGAGSVPYWSVIGDLRPYAVVQFGSLVAIVAILVSRPGPRPDARFLAAGLAAYAAAKALEHGDATILALTGVVSGHTLKHVAAAAAAGCVAAEITARARAGA